MPHFCANEIYPKVGYFYILNENTCWSAFYAIKLSLALKEHEQKSRATPC